MRGNITVVCKYTSPRTNSTTDSLLNIGGQIIDTKLVIRWREWCNLWGSQISSTHAVVFFNWRWWSGNHNTLTRCQWTNSEWYGSIDHYLPTTIDKKRRTMTITRGMYSGKLQNTTEVQIRLCNRYMVRYSVDIAAHKWERCCHWLGFCNSALSV